MRSVKKRHMRGACVCLCVCLCEYLFCIVLRLCDYLRFHFVKSTHLHALLFIYFLQLDTTYCEEGNQKSQDRICLNHCREQHCFTKLLWLLCYDSDRSRCCLTLCDT